MTTPAYREFEILVDHLEQSPTGERSFEVSVLRSPAGEGEAVRRTIPQGLNQLAFHLERRSLALSGLIALGEALADLLLPERLRALFVRSLDRLEKGQGLRLRLRLPSGLADLPWEYMYISRAGDAKESDKDITGFLALDPRISVVRHEHLGAPADFDATPRPRRILAAMACPTSGFEALDLEREKNQLAAILAGISGLHFEPWEHARASDLARRLAGGVDIFHFAGHGDFDAEMGALPLTIEGQGALIFEDDDQQPVSVPSEQIAANLSGRGVQLVVLGACLTGRRDGQNRWSGVAAALMEVGIPAVIAMQYKISDRAAIHFMTGFYAALAAGQTLDQAVSTGRLTVFNDLHPLRESPELGKLWRDWGVPTLYLRADQDFRLTAITDEDERHRAEQALKISVKKSLDTIGPRGVYKAIEAGVIQAGSIESYLKVKKVEGAVIQIEAENISGGEIRVEGEAERVDGVMIGVKAGTIGGLSAPSAQSPTTSPETASADNIICPNCNAPNQAGAKFCFQCGSPLKKTANFCANCGNKLTLEAKFCPNCGARVI
jgi:hypothetical protein